MKPNKAHASPDKNQIYLTAINEVITLIKDKLDTNNFCPDCFIRNMMNGLFIDMHQSESLDIEEIRKLCITIASRVHGSDKVIVIEGSANQDKEFLN